ncbi:MAG: 1,6-anhydro-N-acetylmuramyl-L-alanine amidase AmpD, partial [Pseudomonadales bacterium]
DCTRPGFADLDGLRVSSHLFIRRDGELVQFVPFNRRAWHAGQSDYQGRSECNDFSIGIELEGTDDSGFEQAQYDALGRVLVELRAHYPITDLVGHADIAPGRKTDPGTGFDWARVR